MNSTNYQQVAAVKDFLPDYILTRDNPTPRIPVLSNQSAEIFSKIRQSIPDTTEPFSSIKRLDVSAKEITGKVKEIKELKKHETLHKVGSILATMTTSVLLSAALAGTLFTAILLTNPLAALLLGSCGIPIAMVLISLSCCWNVVAFENISGSKEQLSAQVQETKVNHEKLKNYFTFNYKAIKNEIVDSIERKNHDLELLLSVKEDFSAKKMQLNNEVTTLQLARVQLKNLHRFYNPSGITQ